MKQQLIDSLVNDDTTETEELNERAEKVDKTEDAADIVKEYEENLRTKRKDVISVAYHQGKVFSWFREKEKFMTLVNRFKIHNNSFQINVFKLINKHLGLLKSSITLSFLRNCSKDIGQIFERHIGQIC